MQEKTVEILKNFGFPVLATLGLCWFIVDQQRAHRQERAEWIEVVKMEAQLNRDISTSFTDAIHALEMTIKTNNKL